MVNFRHLRFLSALGAGVAGLGVAADAYTVSGNTYATDGSIGDINSAIGAAAAGSLVTIPSGAFTWNGPVYVTKAVTVSGAGEANTTISLGTGAPTGVNGTVEIYSAATIEGMTIVGQGNATPFAVGAGASSWRITNINYQANGDASYFCFISGGYGVIDSCNITSTDGSNELVFDLGPANSWQTPDSMGTANAVYIEDCVFNGPGYVCDANANARMVVRFCTINGQMKIDAHGYASNTPRGVRHIEVYDNHWTYGAAASSGSGAFPEIELRGGTGMVFDNVSDMANSHGYAWYLLTDYGYEGQWPNFNYQEQTPVNYPIQDQIGLGMDRNGQKAAGGSDPLYSWNNEQAGAPWGRALKPVDTAAVTLYQQQTGNSSATFTEADMIKPDRDVFLDLTVSGSFNGSTGVGRGTKAQMLAIAPSKVGVGFWVGDEATWNTLASGASGQLYAWSGSAWVLKYTPFTYPHPLRSQTATVVPTSTSSPTAKVAASRLINLSARGAVGAGTAQQLYVGFAVAGTGSKNLLLRGDGPALSGFGVADAVSSTSLSLYDSSGSWLATDTGWGNAPVSGVPPASTGTVSISAASAGQMAAVGAFALAAGSADSAMMISCPVGSHTATLIGTGGTSGVGMAEIYDCDATGSATTFSNLSARSAVGSGDQVLIVGFVISGASPQTVLLRAVGPGLGAFGVGGTLAHPRLTLYDSGSSSNAPAVIAQNIGWANPVTSGTSSVKATVVPASAAQMSAVSAFALTAGSADAAVAATLPPGAYTLQVDGADGGTGVALAEIYSLQ